MYQPTVSSHKDKTIGPTLPTSHFFSKWVIRAYKAGRLDACTVAAPRSVKVRPSCFPKLPSLDLAEYVMKFSGPQDPSSGHRRPSPSRGKDCFFHWSSCLQKACPHAGFPQHLLPLFKSSGTGNSPPGQSK